jgi:hypothetical protein
VSAVLRRPVPVASPLAEPDTYPDHGTTGGTTREGTVAGMLSVDTSAGRVPWHSWRGHFLAREDT